VYGSFVGCQEEKLRAVPDSGKNACQTRQTGGFVPESEQEVNNSADLMNLISRSTFPEHGKERHPL
jgi:hypothetical protein